MADDIDIEEHDVLDNPIIKNIFPDITNIKTEVIDYEEEDLDFGNEHIDTLQYETDPEDIDAEIPNLFQNRIILGTKPCASDSSSDDEGTVPKLLESYVVLEDWGVLLANSPCYCHTCQILFPTENSLDSHKMTAHSFLIAVRHNKAIKSTSKSSISARLKFEQEVCEVNVNLCNHCNVAFPDEIALLKHSYELLPRKFACEFCDLVLETEMACKLHKRVHSIVECFRCPICSCYFKYINKLISHVTYQHQTQLPALPERVSTNYNCAFCVAKFKNNKSYNGHILYHHPEFYKKTVDKAENDKFVCPVCNLRFPSAYSEKIHRAAIHTSKSSDVTSRQIKLEKKIKLEPVSPKKLSPQKIDLNRRPIPRSALFKCNKCQLHFVSCTVAAEHTKRCALKKGEWKCGKCRRSFKLVDRQNHVTQHNTIDRFRVITVEGNTLNKLLCRCIACKICFDERTLLKYHINGCTESNSVLCNICNFRIHEHAITKHKRIHNELGSEQFVVVDYVSADQLTIEKQTDVKTANLKKEPRQLKKEKFYYYCPTCQCFMKVNKLTDKHNVGKCNKYLMKCICKLCGLKFSTKSFETHKKEHKKFPHLKLRDLTFKNTQSLKKINPPFPDFKKCTNCKVMFFSGVALKSHVCNVEEAKVCVYCGEKFSDLAYKLHVPFHEYSGEKKKVYNENIPELIKKYESLKTVWNILYLCEICDTILDDYDEVVEHSQNHFCNMESYNITINHCSICDIQIVGDCYEKHKQFHLANSVTKSSFKILRYNYDTLLTDDWFNIFKALAKEQVDQILNKSKYKHTRSVRMELSVDGPIDLTLYQCVVCQVIIDCNAVAEHAQNRSNCVNPTKFNCSMCHLSFSTRGSLKSHSVLHEKHLITNKTFRIISFNDNKDIFVNDSLKSKSNPESLKFIRCQHCGKLINKSKYKKHVEYHMYVAKKKLIAKDSKNQPKFLVRSKYKKIDSSIVHNFYKCKKCGVCVFRNNVVKHFCSTTKQKKQCPKCHLWFRSSHLHKHLMYHDKFKLTKYNINVFIFKNGKIERERRKEDQVVLYQCSDCSVCLHKEMNIKRHICISDNYQKVCRLCEMPFHCSRMQIHEKLHEDKNFTRNNVVIKKFKSKDVLKQCPQKSKPATHLMISKYKKTKINPRHLKLNKKKTKTEYDDPQFLRFAHLRNFKCTECNLLFVTPSALLKHQNSCSTDNVGVKCDSCALIFHKSMINLHKKLRRCGPRSGKLFIVTIDSKAGEKYDETKCLYRCNKCGIHFTSFRAIFNHVKAEHVIVMKPTSCDLCNITLSCHSCPRHKQIHHDRNLALSDLIKLNVFDMSLSKALKDQPNNEMINIIDNSSEDDEIDNLYKQVAVKRKTFIEDNVPSKYIKVNNVISEKIVPSPLCDNFIDDIYHCEICKLNFLHKRTLDHHINVGRHNERKFNCPKCNLIFTQNSLTRHLKFHHDGDELSVVHYERKPLPSDHLEFDTALKNQFHKELVNAELDESIDGDKQVALKRKSFAEGDVPKKHIKLNTASSVNTLRSSSSNSTIEEIYKCDVCNVNFLHKRTLDRHTFIGRHDERKFNCPECDLVFTQNSLTRHIKQSHDPNYSVTYIRKTASPKATDKQIALIEENVKLTPLAVTNEDSKATDAKNNLQQTDNKANKLYKCSACDVYFTCADACQEHVANHVALDPTEYIACKLCDLQFLCEYLGCHMKGHREKTFSIDELIVEEYHVDNGHIKVDTYSAADRLKSKLVTTTTHFDTEDEKNDKDESVIDSTCSIAESNAKYVGRVSNEAISPINDREVNKGVNDVEIVSAPSSEAEKVLS
ncbi:zinc finger protein 729-like [Nymphalis io]|uniref:zinc finger protein 729-like n=1 Tax=Inachis io TaxID=171585 RepID=UPI00216A9647|nr:zinc finger protein 729-like [Nymphalis io]